MDDRIIDVQARPATTGAAGGRGTAPAVQANGRMASGGEPVASASAVGPASAYDKLAHRIPQLHALLHVSMSPDFAWSDEIRTHLLELATDLSNQVNEHFKADLAIRNQGGG